MFNIGSKYFLIAYTLFLGTAMSTLKKVDITPCPKQPCQLKKGTEETIEVTFTPSKN